VAFAHEHGDVLDTSYSESGTRVEVMLDDKALAVLGDYVVTGP
jgi:hypothetical protein